MCDIYVGARNRIETVGLSYLIPNDHATKSDVSISDGADPQRSSI